MLRRRLAALLTATLAVSLLTVTSTTPVGAASTDLDVVVHVPLPASSGATVTVTPEGGGAITATRLTHDYGSIGIVQVPATTTKVSVSATGLTAVNTLVTLRGSTAIWLDADGAPHLSQAKAQGNVVVVRLRGTDVKSATLAVTDGTATSTVNAESSSTASEALFRVPVTAASRIIKVQPSVNGALQGSVREFDATRNGAIWLSTQWSGVRTSKAWADGFAIINYRRADNNYDGWVLHTWSNAKGGAEDPGWQTGRKSEPSAWGVVWKVPLLSDSTNLPFIIHKGDTKDLGKDQFLDLALTGGEVWYRSGSANEDGNAIFAAPVVKSIDADLSKAKAIWLSPGVIAWPYPSAGATKVRLHFSTTGSITANEEGVQNDDESVALTYTTLSLALRETNPHLSTYQALAVPESVQSRLTTLLRGQVVVSMTAADGVSLQRATGVQIGSVLDALYPGASGIKPGVTWASGRPTITVWAPTAASVNLLRFASSTGGEPIVEAMTRDNATGSWSVTGDAAWKNQYYLFRVRVFAPSLPAMVTNDVTDPYSLSLSINSNRSQIVDLSDADLAPAGWSTLSKPALAAQRDASIYELMIRDFSIADSSVPANLRGTYGAFTTDSLGMQHLRTLAKSGLTHLQLGPSFDFATVNEDKSTWKSPIGLEAMAKDSQDQQAAIGAIKDQDGFNWGYDPLHFTTPEGSFAVSPDGSARVREYRSMVAGINAAGLRVIMDVVYNHTNASGQSSKSIFDRIVPGYYHRLDGDGSVTTSTCCANTAAERLMMAKVIRDSILVWARDYKIDGFRFDLMGHHPRDLMKQIRADLDALTIAKDGVDGTKILLFGEGWDFGEVARNARFANATQRNMAGTGIATFDDRIRDAVRGGGPFDSNPRVQGFGSGSFTNSNGDAINGTKSSQRTSALLQIDQVKVGLTGGLSAFKFLAFTGSVLEGREISYGGDTAGYTRNPLEQIAYVDAHDNETLYDALAFKLPRDTTMANRVRYQALSLAIPTLGQGVPFYLAGSDILRSKSLDKNSYDSGDWFNAIDWSLQSNGFGRGLPMKGDNEARWQYAKPLLSDARLMPSKADMERSTALFQEFLKIRYSSPLFRLGTGTDVNARVSYPIGGTKQQPGVLVMRIVDEGKGRTNLDPKYKSMTIVFNAGPKAAKVNLTSLSKAKIELHPLQKVSVDRVVRTASAKKGQLTVPALTVAVFVEK